jgi:ribosome assembly protein 4
MFQCVRSLSSHSMSVTCIKWGGKDLIYSSSQDRTIKVWRAEDVSRRRRRRIFNFN